MAFGTSNNLVNLFNVGQRSAFDVEKLAEGFRKRNTGWSIPEAYLGLLVATAICDGNWHEEEQAEVVTLARRSPVLCKLSMDELAAVNDNVNQRLNRREALREACDTLPEDMVRSLFAHCVQVAVADGELVRAEAQFLETLVPLMSLDPEEATRILEVILVAARY